MILPKNSTPTKKGLQPYWNEVCSMVSSRLWLPTAIDAEGVALNLSKGLSSITVETSWFSTALIIPAEEKHFDTIHSRSLTGLLSRNSDSANCVTKSRKIRLYPTHEQRAIFYRWLGASRFVYNRTLEYLKTLKDKRPPWTQVATDIILPSLPEWAVNIPYQIKKMAIKEACDAYTNVKQKYRHTGKTSILHFKSRKSRIQTCYIPKSAVSDKGIYYTLAGILHMAEELPENILDCELSFQQGRWYLCVPYKTAIKLGENQARIVALDPGVRTFQTFFSPEMAGVLGHHDFGRLVRLCHYLDDLISRYTIETNKKRRYRMKRAADRMRWKIRDLRDELHAKVCRFFVDNFDIILIPSFETQVMVKRERRKLHSKMVRSMLTWAHFRFKQRLIDVADQHGKVVIEVNEAYTSQTCSWSGEIVKIGSSEIICGSDSINMHRDVNGARGIFLRALAEQPSLKSFQRALVSNSGNFSV
jgi:putative transposase